MPNRRRVRNVWSAKLLHGVRLSRYTEKQLLNLYLTEPREPIYCETCGAVLPCEEHDEHDEDLQN
jgi:hypothetical protein